MTCGGDAIGVSPVLLRSASLALVIGHTDLEYRDADAVDRHGCSERGVHQRFDTLADLTARRPLHPYTPQGGDPWLPGSQGQSSGIEQKGGGKGTVIVCVAPPLKRIWATIWSALWTVTSSITKRTARLRWRAVVLGSFQKCRKRSGIPSISVRSSVRHLMLIALLVLLFDGAGFFQLTQFGIPFGFQHRRHQTIVRIDLQVAALGQISFVLCPFHLQMAQALGFLRTLNQLVLDGNRESQSFWSYPLQAEAFQSLDPDRNQECVDRAALPAQCFCADRDNLARCADPLAGDSAPSCVLRTCHK